MSPLDLGVWDTLAGNPYASMKDGGAGAAGAAGTAADMSAAAAWSSAAALQPTAAGYYSYDHPTLAAYGYGGGYDLASRRKNATRESTATLKAWLNEHKKNPYPTKGEKIMLAIITKMTLTQVSTWFANARRRLKKENKMTWEPKNKLDDEDVDVSDDDDKDRDDDKDDDQRSHMTRPGGLHHEGGSQQMDDSGKSGIPIPPSKPKIWSLADTAVCKTPPPPSHLNPGSLGAALGHPQHPSSQHQMSHPMASHQYPGMGAAAAAAHSPWGAAGFSQFDPSVVRPSAMSAALRGNMFGMPHMAGMAGLGHGLGGMMGMSAAAAGMPPTAPPHPAAVSSAQIPAASPSVSALSGNSEGLQNDTPPHTPPTGSLGKPFGTNSTNSSFNGGSVHQNGYPSSSGTSGGGGQLSPSTSGSSTDPASSSPASTAAASSSSKLLPFPGLNNHSSFKMM